MYKYKSMHVHPYTPLYVKYFIVRFIVYIEETDFSVYIFIQFFFKKTCNTDVFLKTFDNV